MINTTNDQYPALDRITRITTDPARTTHPVRGYYRMWPAALSGWRGPWMRYAR